MTIEEQCDKIIEEINDTLELPRSFKTDIDGVTWKGNPRSRTNKPLYHIMWKKAFRKIDGLIKNRDVTECMTSPSRYIRECKKWFMENENE